MMSKNDPIHAAAMDLIEHGFAYVPAGIVSGVRRLVGPYARLAPSSRAGCIRLDLVKPAGVRLRFRHAQTLEVRAGHHVRDFPEHNSIGVMLDDGREVVVHRDNVVGPDPLECEACSEPPLDPTTARPGDLCGRSDAVGPCTGKIRPADLAGGIFCDSCDAFVASVEACEEHVGYVPRVVICDACRGAE